MHADLVFVGWTGRLPPLPPAHVLQVAPLAFVPRALEGRGVVVLGDEALRALDPLALRREIDVLRWQVLACPTSSPASVLARWRDAAHAEVLAPESLPAALWSALDAPDSIAHRHLVEPAEWLLDAPPAGAAILDALRAIPRLERIHDESEWAVTLGISRSALARSCRDALSLSPRQVLDCYLNAEVSAARAAGVPLSRVATRLGFGTTTALLRALDRARRDDAVIACDPSATAAITRPGVQSLPPPHPR